MKPRAAVWLLHATLIVGAAAALTPTGDVKAGKPAATTTGSLLRRLRGRLP